ncbi:hypothetical protein DIPPA_04793 [Diplonema papillatum]|nr:hypothetical protein DIPPA_04793 [Diplonema papillatum]
MPIFCSGAGYSCAGGPRPPAHEYKRLLANFRERSGHKDPPAPGGPTPERPEAPARPPEECRSEPSEERHSGGGRAGADGRSGVGPPGAGVLVAAERTLGPLQRRPAPSHINKFIGFKRSRHQDPNSMIITSDQQQAHDLATTCHYCEGPFTEKNPKVRDHCHLTNKYRAAACNNCNKLIREGSGTIPLYFHNARGYDNHHVYTMLSQRDSIDNDCVNIIENTSERTMCIELNQKRTYTDKTGETKTAKDNWSISVRDSVQILGSTSSLATHINSLPIEKRTCMKQCIETYLKRPADDDTLELLLRKQVFPYSWFDAPSKLQHRSINNDPEAQVFSDDPSIWYDCLTGAAADSSDIEHVKKVWEIMGFESFKDYHDFYLKLDVCGLADVMRAFRDELMSTHKLDPCHFISLSSFTWAAMLRSTKVKLEHLTDHEMYLFFESQKRGGFTCAIERHAQGTDNTADVTNKMIYVDANNLYGHSMMRNLPHSGFRWLPNLTVDNVLHLTSCYNPESSTGYVFEVDIEYPEHLHELHDDLPLLPYNRSIAHDELSDYQQQALGDVPLCAVPKLIADFKKREKYIINIEQLQFAIKHGLVVTAVHRGITFQQSAWLKPYIELNSTLRQQATSDFGKGLYKLLNNAIFGKTMENVRGRTDAIITSASDEQNLIREQSKFRFKRRQDINNMSIITHGKCSVKLDKPVYVGSQILDYSKILMASFFHDKLVPTYGRDNTRLVYTDTDSFILQIKTGDIWKELAENHKHLAEGFDFSNFPKDHNLYSKDKAKVPGYFKCETAEKLLKEVVCLRAKSYAYTTHDGYSDCKAKGVPMRCAKEFTIDTYRRVLDTREDQEVQFKTIQSRGHQLYTMAQSKRAFSAFDDKRWIEADGVRTRAYR